MAFNLNPFKKTSSGSPTQPGFSRPSSTGSGNTPPKTDLSGLDFSNSQQAVIEVTEIATGIGVVYEEAAVLYANGNDRDAEQLLTAVFDDPTATVGEGLWMMLLDLYRLTGQRERFDARVIDYARRFERSPPAWEDLSLQPSKRRAEAATLINLPAALTAQTAQQLQQICLIGRKSGTLRIDIGRVRSIDDQGCLLVKQALEEMAAGRVKLTIFNASRLVDLLSPKVKPGQPENRDYWMLMLEMLKYTGEVSRFEDLAVDYAVTFEESPPSWESKQPLPGEEQSAANEGSSVHGEEEFFFDNELTGSSSEVIRKLDEFASTRQTVRVDCGQLRRVDFVAAGTLFNALASLQANGKIVQLHRVNAMIGALMRVMSIDQVAQVILRG